jgi:hypothetical protein
VLSANRKLAINGVLGNDRSVQAKTVPKQGFTPYDDFAKDGVSLASEKVRF